MVFGLQKKAAIAAIMAVLMLSVVLAGCSEKPSAPTTDITGNMVADNPVSGEDTAVTVDDVKEPVEEVEVIPADDAPVAGELKTFVLSSENFKFIMDSKDNPDLKVSVGDTVRIELTAGQGFHDWKVDEFSAATEKVRDGASTSVEFVAGKAGTFEYYCSVGSHRQMGMKGKLIVE